jgi:hypothetical protein
MNVWANAWMDEFTGYMDGNILSKPMYSESFLHITIQYLQIYPCIRPCVHA